MTRPFYHYYVDEVRDRIDRTTSVYMTEAWDGSTVDLSLQALREAATELKDVYATLLHPE